MANATPVDADIVRAIAYCRLGGQRPKHTSSFVAAKALGLLAQDPVWRATPRGEGALVVAGLLAGAPARERRVVAMRWAVCTTYQQPQLVRTWTEWTYEHVTAEQLEEVDQAFRDYGDPHDWRFWTTFEAVELPDVPDHEEALDAA